MLHHHDYKADVDDIDDKNDEVIEITAGVLGHLSENWPLPAVSDFISMMLIVMVVSDGHWYVY